MELVKANQELNLVSKKREYDDRVEQELAKSKATMNAVKGMMLSYESSREKADEAKQQQAAAVERLKIESKIAAFKRSSKEIDTMYVTLHKAYTFVGQD